MTAIRDRNVLITGGASGLGLGFAHALASLGARIIIADSSVENGQAAERQLKDQNHKATFVNVDVTSAASVASMIKAALAWVPGGEAIDAAILSAGVNGNPFDLSPEDPSALSTPEAWQAVERNAKTLNVNLTAVLQCVQLVVKYGMGLPTSQSQSAPTSAKASVKSITLIGSLASYRALPRAVDYSASKWGVRGAFRSLRQQLPKIGVRINMIAPGFVKTPLLAHTIPMYEQIGVHFVEEADVVEATVKVVSDVTCSGRAFAVGSQGALELHDEAGGMDASTAVNELLEKGVFGTPSCPMGRDEQTVHFQ
ncbi:Hypothetical predicted protein [Lecanosticta acicola]|uniref:Ketoreductase domain-containing protein n=1 Tax=Lecanosticta acicola TaxID=111012 RepID=A0AAI9EFM1_9PEZI|nr:Hypothetical predicted protein [Lecanosticta acicola]